MDSKEEILLFVMAATNAGINTNEEFRKAMLWIGGDEWEKHTPEEWRVHVRDTHSIYIDGPYGYCLDRMFEEYKKHNKEVEDVGSSEQ